jgi:hypothetical protein
MVALTLLALSPAWQASRILADDSGGSARNVAAIKDPAAREAAASAGDPIDAPREDVATATAHAHPGGGMCFLEVLQAISGKKCTKKTIEMLKDVVEIQRLEDRIVSSAHHWAGSAH